MSQLKIGVEGPDGPALLTVDFTPDSDGDISDGALGFSGGNMYLYVDGVEYGSLWVRHEDGHPKITMGRYDDEAGEWIDSNTLTHPDNT